ncbi:histidine phosphatase family protein [bacterium]|nr:histidine phosphatase family protein [bacterium]
MKRTLLILRHGKSLRGPEYSTDFERPLAPRGIKAARRMARFTKRKKLAPELIITSQAARALGTAELFAAELDDVELIAHDEIYDADIDDLYDIVEDIDDHYQRVMLVGHNPTFEMFVDDLTGTYNSLLKTCSLAVVANNCASWGEFAATDGKLVGIYHPRELPD